MSHKKAALIAFATIIVVFSVLSSCKWHSKSNSPTDNRLTDDTRLSQWAAVGDIYRCVRPDGCELDSNKYSPYSEFRSGTVYCGELSAPDNPMGFECLKNAQSNLLWVCTAEQCECGKIQIGKDQECIQNTVLAANGGVYKTQTEFDRNDPVCDNIHYSEIPVEYKANFRCENGKWTCQGELICAEGSWFCVERGHSYPALCRNFCAGEDYGSYGACNGQREGDDSIVPCETLKKDKYGDYINKHYNHLNESTCNGYLGGYCRHGYNSIKKSETCAAWDFVKFGGELSNRAYDIYRDYGSLYNFEWLEEVDAGVCIEGNCPCGDGACPQYSVCHNGQCICGHNVGTNYGEFYCQIEVGNFETEWSLSYEHVLICQNEKGCHTKDGQYYNNGAKGNSGIMSSKNIYPEDEEDIDTESDSLETDSENMSEIENGGVNRCDLPEGCACGNEVCPWGATCDDNVCVYDDFYSRHWFPQYVNVDQSGNGICAGMILKPQWGVDFHQSYICSDMGWLCKQKDGCACGNVQCDAGAYCITPGVCTEPVGPCSPDDNGRCDYKKLLDAIRGCESGLYNSKGRCCKNGKQDNSGECCDSGVLSKFGQCCESGRLDSNNRCLTDKGSMDVTGEICSTSVLDRENICCESGVLSQLDRNITGNSFPEGWFKGDCCPSGVLTRNGKCCKKEDVAADGSCRCNDYGYSEKNYGGYEICCEGVTDKQHHCCKSGVLSSNGYCCDEDDIDANGNCKNIYGPGGVKCESKVFATSGNGMRRCCESGVLNSKGDCCHPEDVGADGRCICDIATSSGVSCCGKDSQKDRGGGYTCCRHGKVPYVDRFDDEYKCCSPDRLNGWVCNE